MSLAKYAAVVSFRMSFSFFSRTFSARSRALLHLFRRDHLDSSTIRPADRAALTQFRSVCAISPNSLAAALAVIPSLTRVTASSLELSGIYLLRYFHFVFPFMVTAIVQHHWKTKVRGKLISRLWLMLHSSSVCALCNARKQWLSYTV
jgi:hypothetical protein